MGAAWAKEASDQDGGLASCCGTVDPDPVQPTTTPALPFSPSVAGGRARKLKHSSFDWIRVLGVGSYGRVIKVVDRKYGQTFACKEQLLRVGNVSSRFFNPRRELKVLQATSHPFVVPVRGWFETSGVLCMLLEYLAGGELTTHLKQAGRFDEARVKMHLAEISLALQHLRTRGIVHRDVKLDNLILNPKGQAVLADFGFAKFIQEGELLFESCGTMPYLSPETLDKRGVSFEADWWSLGVVGFTLLCGRFPFCEANKNEAEVKAAIRNADISAHDFPQDVSVEARDAVLSMLQLAPEDRTSSVFGLATADWFAGFDWQACENGELEPPQQTVVQNGVIVVLPRLESMDHSPDGTEEEESDGSSDSEFTPGEQESLSWLRTPDSVPLREASAP
eukprot:Hpha_TRINITY_DN16435_c1_g3::TRINITY_DN16435_c1_g3_i1::g.162478::m.162478